MQSLVPAQSAAHPLFTGLCAFPPTPADEKGRVDTTALQDLVSPIADSSANSIGLVGSTGIYMYLETIERQRAVEAALECVGGRCPVIVNVGALRTDVAILLANHAAKAGANGLLLAPVAYTPLTQDEVFQHYRAVATTSDLPLCIYNNPSTTGFNFSEDLLGRLATISNIVAVKMPIAKDDDFSGEISRLRGRTPADFAIGYSGDWKAAEALLAGCDAWHSVVGGLFPQAAAALVNAALTGDRTETMRLDGQFQPLWELFQSHGSLRVIHVAAHLLGHTRVNLPRPLLPLARDIWPSVEKAILNVQKA